MRRTLLIIFCLFVFLSIVQVVVSNSMATTGVTVAKMDDELKRLKRENALLREKVSFASSFSKIASDAATLGFVELRLPLVITNSVPVAFKQ